MFGPWSRARTFDALLARLRAACIKVGEWDPELWCINGSMIRNARCSAGGEKVTHGSLVTMHSVVHVEAFPRRS